MIDMLKKLYPDLLEVIQQRYEVLHSVNLFQPIGRRALAETIHLTERTVRNEIDFLHKHNYIQVTTKGMHVTDEGKVILDQLSQFMSEIMGLGVLQKQIQEKLNVKNVIIVPGNSDRDDWVKQAMGKSCATYLKTIVKPGSVIAVTGGTTIAAVARSMTPFTKDGNCLFVPARGGIGEKVENQANTIVAEMAKRTNGKYRMLFVPDLLSEQSYQSIINEPSIEEVLKDIKGANIVVHGIGEAITMAKRRGTSKTITEKLINHEAVSEAFGYYFNQEGKVVHKVRTVGLQLEDLTTEKFVVTVAGGQSKGQAIASYFQKGRSDLLITDEAAAKQILRDTP